jgi:hypothetical protein
MNDGRRLMDGRAILRRAIAELAELGYTARASL